MDILCCIRHRLESNGMENNMINNKNYFKAVGIDLTYKCNFRCRHCYNYSGDHGDERKELSEEEFLNLCNSIIKIAPMSTCICGGEPLLKRNLALEMGKRLKKAGLPNINIVSNGYIIDKELAREIKKAGFDFIQISLDGFKESHEWLRGKEGAYDRAINAISNLVGEGCNVGVAFTPLKRNISEFEELTKMLDNMGVLVLRTQPIMGMGRATGIRNEFLSPLDYYKLTRKIAYMKQKKQFKKLNIEWGDPLEHLIAMAEKKNKIYTLQITAYGDIQVSPYIPISFGNVNRHKLEEYATEELLKGIQTEAFQKICLKMCDVNNMLIGGDAWEVEVGINEDYVMDLIDDVDCWSQKSKEIMEKLQEGSKLL